MLKACFRYCFILQTEEAEKPKKEQSESLIFKSLFLFIVLYCKQMDLRKQLMVVMNTESLQVI